MNKILAGLATVTLLATAFAPALAQEPGYQVSCGNDGHVCNVQMADTNTGDNGIANTKAYGGDSDSEKNNDNVIVSGVAASYADAKTLVNSDLRDGCCGLACQDNYSNTAFVKNFQTLYANSGDNGIANSKAYGGDSDATNNDGNEIRTGIAQVQATAKTIANSNLSNGCCGDQTNGLYGSNSATVINVQKLSANTGDNGIANSMAKGGDSTAEGNDNNIISTGNAIADAAAFTIVNSNILRAVEQPETDGEVF